jgi:hypothetical protein
MATSDQELSELKTRVLTAIRTGSNIAHVETHLCNLIRESGPYLPERAKSDTDAEYLYSVILSVESKNSGAPKPVREAPVAQVQPTVEVAPVVVTEEPVILVEEASDVEASDVEAEQVEEASEIEAAPSQPEDNFRPKKSKGGQKSKK